MIKFFKDNKQLYSPLKQDYLSSLELSKNLKNSENKNLIFHCFWRVPKDFGRKQLAVLKSIIVNHKDIISSVEINLWSNVDLSNNDYFKEVEKFVTLRKWDLNEEIKNTILEDCVFLSDKENIYDDICYLEGDLFRLLILHKYGGIYIDMDVLILRNFLPLNDFEFLYQWGTSGFRGENFRMNGAIMKLNKNSDLSLEFLEILKSIPPNKGSFVWGNEMYSKISRNEVLALPGIWFNSEWGFEGTRCDPFVNIGDVDLFDGAFAWHWHNRWDEPVQIGSKFEIIESSHKLIFEKIVCSQ
jgi:hypothetical protein